MARTKEEIKEIRDLALEAACNVGSNNKEKRIRGNKLLCFVQVLNWVTESKTYNVTTQDLINRIERLKTGEEKTL